MTTTREWTSVDTATLRTIADHLRHQIDHPNRIDIWSASARKERTDNRESDRAALASAEAEIARREATR
jgi:hypothetical protein